jgi:predicted transcriptional regulator
VARYTGEPVSVLAKEIGIPPQQLYPIAKKLVDDNRIVKSGRGYELTSNGRGSPARRAKTKQTN